MKKVGFLVVLGFALLGLFGCVSDGGGILGPSSAPTGQWEVWTLKDSNGDGKGDSLDQVFPVEITIVDDVYQVVVYDTDFTAPVEDINAEFDFPDPEVTFHIYRVEGFPDYDLDMTGTLNDSSDNTEDYMFGEYDETVGNSSGQWIALRPNSKWYAEDPTSSTLKSGGDPLTQVKKVEAIEKFLSGRLGEEVQIEISENLKEKLE
ncbi:MAG TPA: hypothetical protein DEA49_06045 [Petrotoga sp.]|nr:hypothetical protein [Petrotoga sp.]